MDTAVTAWLKSQLGPDTDQADLADRYTRLGTARAVALEVLRERLAALRAQPSTIGVSGVVSLNVAENIRSYERQIAQLEAGNPPAPDDPDLDGDGLPDTSSSLGTIRLIERPRR